jgi:tRNA uridine 5-carboxymethylaminomethyl modification enzyme
MTVMNTNNDYDILVIGAGHAGCEAALASARMGINTAIFTMNLENIGQMSCNPAIGGLAKSHLVKEIDALGGEMAKVTDRAGIQFKVLNRSKGPAVWATRVQADRALYRTFMRQTLERQNGLDIRTDEVLEVLTEGGRVSGIRTTEKVFRARAVIIATGTFLNGLIHIGLENFPAGRAGEPPSTELSKSLGRLGLRIGRLKTGTPPRLDAETIDFSVMTTQEGDEPPPPMSLFTREIKNPQFPCFITYTNEQTHKIISDNLGKSPLYSGKITGIGPRYCPSIEDKVVKFRERTRHQIFLEPEGIDSDEYYANGISTSLPSEAQVKFVNSIEGLEETIIRKDGYAIEYDFVFPTQLKPTLETKNAKGLFLAGQINGTSGYEEAAAQGFIAGINAVLSIRKKPPFILGRHEAYIGVLIDDLVTRGTREPYRMFTSRAEYRLLLRQDNADIRLMEKGYQLGLINRKKYNEFCQRQDIINAEQKRLTATRVKPGIINPVLKRLRAAPVRQDVALSQLLKRPEVKYIDIVAVRPPEKALPCAVAMQIEIQTKYEGYLRRRSEQAERFSKIEEKKIPEDFTYRGISGLSREILEKLEEVRPLNLGQAGRIPGVTPAAISLLIVALERHRRASHVHAASQATRSKPIDK